MATFTKTILSGSTDGRGIKVVATATAGTTIHTGPTAAGTLHRITLYAVNTDTSARTLTVQWGGTSSPDDSITYSLQVNQGLILVAPALLIKGNATPLVVRAFASAANVVVVHGEVDVIA